MVVIVDQCQRSGRRVTSGLPIAAREPLANQLADRFAASGELLLLAILVKLFQQVFYEIRKQIVLKTEPILLILLNYVLAICASRADIRAENPRSYLARALEQLQRVPTDVLIFSPINKINLSREDIIMEMETFEENLV